MAYDLPPWLQGTPDEPAKIFLAGVNAGSGVASNAIRSRALSEERRQFDTMMAVKQKLYDQEQQLGEIKIKTLLRNRQEQIDAERAYEKVARLYSDHKLAGIAGTDASEARLGHTIANDPSFYTHPGAQSLLGDMFLSRKTADVARERQNSLDELAIREAGLIERALMSTDRTEKLIEGRKDVAELRSETDIQEAQIKADADIRKSLIAAEKWLDHSRFAAYKAGLEGLKKSDPEYPAKAKALYLKMLPTGETNAWDQSTAAPLAPLPRLRWDKDGMKEVK